MQDLFSDLMNMIAYNYNLYLLLEREFTYLFEQVIDKEIKVAYWQHLNNAFSAPYLRELIKVLFIKKIGALWLEESFQVYPF